MIVRLFFSNIHVYDIIHKISKPLWLLMGELSVAGNVLEGVLYIACMVFGGI